MARTSPDQAVLLSQPSPEILGKSFHLSASIPHLYKCWRKPVRNVQPQRDFKKWPRVSDTAQGFAVQAALWPGMKAPWFCCPRSSSSLLTQRVRTLPAERPTTQRTSARCLGSELPGGKNFSRRTETLISPRPGGGDAKRAVRLSLSLASFSFHSARCFRLLGLLVLSDLPNITRAFTGLKHFQVFTTTSPPQGDLQTALLAVLSLAGSLEFLNLCA